MEHLTYRGLIACLHSHLIAKDARGSFENVRCPRCQRFSLSFLVTLQRQWRKLRKLIKNDKKRSRRKAKRQWNLSKRFSKISTQA